MTGRNVYLNKSRLRKPRPKDKRRYEPEEAIERHHVLTEKRQKKQIPKVTLPKINLA